MKLTALAKRRQDALEQIAAHLGIEFVSSRGNADHKQLAQLEQIAAHLGDAPPAHGATVEDVLDLDLSVKSRKQIEALLE